LFFKGQLAEDQLAQNLDEAIQPKSKTTILKTKELYGEYLEFGGFPEVVLTPDRETKRQVLKNIFASFFEKDIKVFTELRNVRELRDLILLLATKLASELELNRVKIYNYLELLEGIFFLRTVPKYSKSIDRTVAGGKKVYFSDTGILNLVAKVTDGQLLETAVANQLANYGELSFYNKRNKSEIDFILKKEIAFEVKQKVSEVDFKKLQNLCSEIGIERKHLISNTLSEIEITVYPWFI
jgi:predicted AAA+ superfamily ATPase